VLTSLTHDLRCEKKATYLKVKVR